MASMEASVNDFEVEISQREGQDEKGSTNGGRRESSGKGSTEEASKALLVMQRGEPRARGRKRRLAGDDSNPQKKKTVSIPFGEIRPTTVVGAYCEFMNKLAPKIRQWHREAYCGSTFLHYIQFGAPALDRKTLEHVLGYHVAEQTFSIPDAISGEKKIVNFELDWVRNHTFFPIHGEVIVMNRDPKCRMWVQYFAKLFKDEEKGEKKRKVEIKLRKYVEDLLESLVESTEKKDIQDFVLLQIIYQCSMIWCPRSGEGFPRLLLRYLDSIERVKTVAWGAFIHSEIIRGIKVASEGLQKAGVTYIPGCMPLIPVSSMLRLFNFIINVHCLP